MPTLTVQPLMVECLMVECRSGARPGPPTDCLGGMRLGADPFPRRLHGTTDPHERRRLVNGLSRPEEIPTLDIKTLARDSRSRTFEPEAMF